MDLGECPRIHDLALRADFEAAQKLQDHFYDVRFQSSNWFMCSLTLDQVDACDHLASFVSDCDRKTEQAKKKLAETQEALSDEVGAGQHHCHHHHHHRHHHKQGPTWLFRWPARRIVCTTSRNRLGRNLLLPSCWAPRGMWRAASNWWKRWLDNILIQGVFFTGPP